MIIKCYRDQLLEATLNVCRAIPSKSNFDALEGILIRTDSDKILLTGYNLELGIKTSVSADITGEGSLLLSAHLFSEIIKKLSGDFILIETEDGLNVTIKSGDAEFSLIGKNTEEYPQLPAIDEENKLAISQKIIKSMIRQTKFAVAVDDNKPVHKGVLFETIEGYLNLVAVDGYRLAMRKTKIDIDEYLKFVVPVKTLSEIEKLLSDNEDDMLNIMVGTKQIYFEVNEYQVISRLLEGTFLDYTSAIPKISKTELEIDTKILIDCFERASLVIVERMKSPVRCIFEDDIIKISCSTNIGKSFEQLEVKMDGETVEIGFNNRYLLDALRATETERVKILLSGANSPMRIVPPDNDEFLYLVLPVRLKESF